MADKLFIISKYLLFISGTLMIVGFTIGIIGLFWKSF